MLSDICLTSVGLTSIAYIGPKSRTKRPRNTKIGTEVTNATRDSDTTFEVKGSKAKGQGHQAALLTAVLRRQAAAAAVSVGTYWPWETILLRCVCSAARGASASRRRRGAGTYRGGRPPTACSKMSYQVLFIGNHDKIAASK